MAENTYIKDHPIVERSTWRLPWVEGQQRRIRVFLADLRAGRLIGYLPYVLYLVLLGVLYIGHRHHVDRVIRRIDAAKLEVENLRAAYLNEQARYMYGLKRTELLKRVSALGLVESPKPPEVIYLDE